MFVSIFQIIKLCGFLNFSNSTISNVWSFSKSVNYNNLGNWLIFQISSIVQLKRPSLLQIPIGLICNLILICCTTEVSWLGWLDWSNQSYNFKWLDYRSVLLLIELIYNLVLNCWITEVSCLCWLNWSIVLF